MSNEGESGAARELRRVRALLVELVSELLDETVALGELGRIAESVRQTVSERERGMEEYRTAAVTLTDGAAEAVVETLLR